MAGVHEQRASANRLLADNTGFAVFASPTNGDAVSVNELVAVDNRTP